MKILIVDDNEVNVMLLEEVLKEKGYETYSFLNPLEAIKSLETNQYDLAFIDYMMSEINGIEVIKKIKEKNSETIVVMLTAANSNDVKLEALKVGANEFLSKPIDTAEIIVRVENSEKIIKSNKILKDYSHTLEKEVKEATKKLLNSQYETLAVLSNVAEYRDEDTNLHTKRVAYYSKLIAKKSGLDEETQDIIFYASPLHDVGKIGIPDNILLKPGKLTDEEFEIMRTHATIGYDMLKDFPDNKYLKAGAEIALTHHEKFNGKGYPNGLKGDEIDIKGQIVAIADVFDALTSVRPYKKAWPLEKAFNLIEEELGGHFNPYFGRIFLDNKDEVLKIYNKYKD
jgi:putative two-component system response regulator